MANRSQSVCGGRRSLRVRNLLGCVLLLAAGCGSSGPNLVPVEGLVTIDGKPVPTGRIEFIPESGRPSSANINSVGRYELTTYDFGDGARPGKYRVTISARLAIEDGPVYRSFEDEMQGNVSEPASSQQSAKTSPRNPWIVPRRYSHRSSSDLVAEVGNEAKDIDFQLQSKP